MEWEEKPDYWLMEKWTNDRNKIKKDIWKWGGSILEEEWRRWWSNIVRSLLNIVQYDPGLLVLLFCICHF